MMFAPFFGRVRTMLASFVSNFIKSNIKCLGACPEDLYFRETYIFYKQRH